MPFQPVPNTAQVDMVFDYFGEVVENVYHVEKGSPWTHLDLLALCEVMTDWWKANLRPNVAPDLVLQFVEAKDLTTDGGATAFLACVADCDGTGGSNGLPGNVSLAVSLKTGLAGRSFRGRKFHLGLQEAQVSGNHLSGTTATTLDTAYSALIGAIAAGGWTWVVVSRFHDGAPRSVGLTTPITAVEVDNATDSQRRRLAGRGS